ncbi:MAG: NAD(P)H-binding protein [Chitinophagaceae bacterium]
MKNVLITGSTGMIGHLVLQKCLKHDGVQQVTSITRRKSGVSDPGLVEILHNDFLDYAAIANSFKNQDLCFFCIGVYTGQVSREVFRRITVDYTKAFALALKENSPGATLCFLSGQGADQTEKSPIMFAMDKGIAENFLLSLGFGQTYIFRPGYIYPVTPRKEPNFSYKVMRWLYPLMKKLYPSGVITSQELVDAMVDIGMNGGGKRVYENRDIRGVRPLG